MKRCACGQYPDVCQKYGHRGEPRSDLPVTFVLYGVPFRDQKELVCMFFDSMRRLDAFRADLPGRYKVMALNGVDFNSFDTEHIQVPE